ncbi:MAG: hypothetical protein R3E40_04090 [Rhodocyclaceae bacterium]
MSTRHPAVRDRSGGAGKPVRASAAWLRGASQRSWPTAREPSSWAIMMEMQAGAR